MSNKTRLDILLTERGLAESRQKAQAVIMAGHVFVAGQRVDKPGTAVLSDAPIEVRGHTLPYVSRGGLKLEKAMKTFPITLTDKICADIGASTGGFTDCLLQHGAAQVFAVDVGKSQLHPRLAADPRVVVLDGCNARHLQPDDLPEPVDLAVTDVSFISLRLILPAIDRLLRAGGETVALIKPQFEAGREEVEKGGVVRNPQTRQLVVERIRDFGVQSLGWQWLDFCPSPIRGPAGNVEYLSYWRKGS